MIVRNDNRRAFVHVRAIRDNDLFRIVVVVVVVATSHVSVVVTAFDYTLSVTPSVEMSLDVVVVHVQIVIENVTFF